MAQAPDSATYKGNALIRAAEARSGSGDVEGARSTLAAAQKTLALVEAADVASKNAAVAAIAKINLNIGQGSANTEAQEDEGCLPSPSRSGVQTSDWIAILTDGDARHNCPLNTSPFLDLSAHLNDLPRNPDAWVMFNSLEEVLSTLLKADKAVDRSSPDSLDSRSAQRSPNSGGAPAPAKAHLMLPTTELIDDLLDGNVVLLCGAGISTRNYRL